MLEVVNVSKKFGGIYALKGVSAIFYDKEVHGIVGENGAGKSTLVKIIAGLYKPNEGSILIDGTKVDFNTVTEAYNCGVRLVYQELSLINSLTIAENMFIHNFRHGSIFKVLKRSELEEKAKEILDEWGVDVKPNEKVANVSMGIRQLIEIARALITDGKIIVLDEPTSSLTDKEINHLFEVIRILKKRDIVIIFISHRLDEILTIVDRITVLRDGEVVGSSEIGKLTPDEICKMMVGRGIKNLYPKLLVKIGEKVFETKNFSGKGFKNISIYARKGEIVGLAGLIGAGRSELCRAIYGIDKHDGDLFISGKKVRIKNPSHAVVNGILYLSENRFEEGIFFGMSVAINIIILKIRNVIKFFLLNLNLLKDITNKSIRMFNIVCNDPLRQNISELSGGNQQKVLFSRLFLLNPKILLLDEPTRGIDVQAKAEIHKIMGNFVDTGGTILLISSELDELIKISDRIYVLRKGNLVAEYERRDFNKVEILKRMMGLTEEMGEEK